jgi:predicted Rossmann fold flavoprotein
LKIEESFLFALSGVSLKNVSAQVCFNGRKEKTLHGDLLFTHYGISGPLTYKISSYFAYKDFSKENPLKISFNLAAQNFEIFDEKLNETLKQEARKDILNVISRYAARNLVETILEANKIDPKIKAGQLKKEDRIKISNSLTSLTVNAFAAAVGEEIVMAGGVDLKEINSKSMESKLVKNLYFCGEIIDADGLTGGFNLQNCWSTGFVAGSSV